MRAAPLVWWFLFLRLNMKKISLRDARFALSHGAHVCVRVKGSRTFTGVYNTPSFPHIYDTFLGQLTTRQFDVLISSGFIACSDSRECKDGSFCFYYTVGGEGT